MKDNWKLLARNWPSGVVEGLTIAGADIAANYALAYNNALDQGLTGPEAANFAFAFTKDKTPVDLLIDAMGKMTEGTVLAWAPAAARLMVAGSRTEDGKLIDPRTKQNIGIEAGRGGRDISPKGTGGDYGVPKQFNRGGYIKRKGIMRY